MVDRRAMGRRLTRQDFLLLSAGAGAGIFVAGCGGGPQNNPGAQGGSGGDGGKAYDGPKVDLAFWNGFTGGDGPYMRDLVEKFNSEHKNINVKMNVQEWADYYTKVPSAVASGQGPDVGIMHTDQLGTNAARSVIVPLDDVAKNLSLKESDFAPVVWKAGIYGDQRYGIPLDMHPLGFYYNKTVMEEAGLDPNKPPTNRDEYESALDELKGKGVEGSWMTPFRFTGGLMFESLLWQFGGDLYNQDGSKALFGSDAGVEAITWMVNLINNGHSPKNIAQDADINAFQNNKNAFNWNGIWAINIFGENKDLDWGVAPLPQIGSEKGAWAGSHNFVVMRQKTPDDNKLQASKVFINWISQNSLEWAKGGQIPARKSVRESGGFEDLKLQSILAEQVPYLNFVPPVPGIGDVETNALDVAVNEAITLKKSPKQALQDGAAKADKLLEENRQKYQG